MIVLKLIGGVVVLAVAVLALVYFAAVMLQIKIEDVCTRSGAPRTL